MARRRLANRSQILGLIASKPNILERNERSSDKPPPKSAFSILLWPLRLQLSLNLLQIGNGSGM